MKYYISNLDQYSAVLPIFSYRRRDEPVPLWSSPSSDHIEEYYEIQVQTNEAGDSSEDRENASTRRCPICDVDVPTKYWEEHKSAAKHLATAAIVASALDRSLKLTSAETAAIPLAPIAGASNSTYYCSSCSCAVSLSKRSAHENSKQHLDSVLYDKLIDSFLILYKEKNNLKAVCEDIVKKIGEEEVVKVLQLEKYSGSDIDGVANDSKLKNNYELQSKGEVMKPIDPRIDLFEDPNKNRSKKNISKSVKEESHDYYFKIADDLNKVVCVFCNLKFPNTTENINQHSSHVNHKNNRTRILDENYLEDIDGTNVFCGICQKNFLTINELDHIDSKKHKKQKDILFNKAGHEYTGRNFLKENYMEDIDGINVFCGICQKTVPKINELDHINSKKHKKQKDNIFNKEVLIKQGKSYEESREHSIKGPDAASTSKVESSAKLEVTKPAPAPKAKRLYYPFSKSDGLNMWKCNICYIDFPIDEAEEHKSDLNHNRIYNDLLESHNMVSIKKKVICGSCREVIKVGRNREYIHFNSEEHKYNLNRECIKKHELQELAQKLIDNYETHGIKKVSFTQHEAHDINKVTIKQHSFDSVMFLNNTDYASVFCGICQKTVPKIDELDHINSEEHKKQKDSIFNKELLIKHDKSNEESKKHPIAEPDTASTFQQLKVESSTNLEVTNPTSAQKAKKLYYLFTKSDHFNMLKCKICNIHFPTDKAEEHKSDLNHNQIYNDLLESGLL